MAHREKCLALKEISKAGRLPRKTDRIEGIGKRENLQVERDLTSSRDGPIIGPLCAGMPVRHSSFSSPQGGR